MSQDATTVIQAANGIFADNRLEWIALPMGGVK